jgi:HEAT repeat protein
MWMGTPTVALLLVAAFGPAAARAAAQDAPVADRAESLLKNLHAENVDVRRKAAKDIQLSGRNVQHAAIHAMIELLAREKDGQVRLAVLDTFASLGHEASSAVPALIESLRTDVGGTGQEASHQDYRSALALAAIGNPAVQGLRCLLTERKESVRAEAAMALGRIGPDAEFAVPDLIVLLGNKNERIRREASLALGRIGTAASEPLITASKNSDVVIRANAVEAMGHMSIPNDHVKSIVVKCARDQAATVRAAAVKSLTELKLPDDVLVPILKENVRHEDERVRLAVVNLLVERRTLLPPMASELESLLTAENEKVSRHAAFLLGMSGPNAAHRLLNALPQKGSRIDQIAEALTQIGRPAVSILSAAVIAREPRLRRGAALALGQIRPLAPGTVQKLTAGLNDPDHFVRSEFLSAMGYLGSGANEAVPSVRAMLRDTSPAIRVQAIQLLFKLGPRDGRLVDDLMTLLNDSDSQVEHQAIDILRSLGPLGRPALTVVIGKLKSSDAEVRLAAAEMIGTHGPAALAAVPALSMMLADPGPKLRTIAAQTLGTIGTAAQPAFPRLTPLLGAEQVDIREAVAFTLGNLGIDAEVLRPHLAKALRDNNAEVRRAAMKSIQRLGSAGAIFVPDIILMAEKKENARLVERTLRRFDRGGADARSLPELVKLLENKQDTVRLLAIKFLKLAGQGAKDALPALERMHDDPSAEVRKQAESACEQIKKKPADR